MGVVIREVQPEAPDAFLALPRAVYRHDRWCCLPTEAAVARQLTLPDYAGRQRLLLALRDGAPAARVAARLSPGLRDAGGAPVGLLGLFEAHPDAEATEALLRAAASWLVERGAGRVIGPMDGDTWHRYRLAIGPFSSPPFLMEPYNPPYYAEMWLAAGFQPFETYYSKVVRHLQEAVDKTARIADRVLRHGYTLRALNPARWADDLRVLHSLSVEIFKRNALYTPIAWPEFLALYDGSRPLVDPAFVWFACTPDGREVGFVFAFPDNFRAVAAMHGRRTPWARLRFALLRGRTHTLNIKTLGVLPACEGTGLASALMHRVYSSAVGRGFTAANLCLIRDGNASGRLDAGEGELLRRYVLYQRAPPPPSGAP